MAATMEISFYFKSTIERSFNRATPGRVTSVSRCSCRGAVAEMQCYPRTQRSASTSSGHCTAFTFFCIAQLSVRRYSGT